MRIILIGPPGSGKGTQAYQMSEQYGLPHLAMGDMLRKIAAEPTTLGHEIAFLLEKGQLVQDNMAISLIKSRVAQPDCQKGFILDGFPRTITQADRLTHALSIDLVIEFSVPEPVIIQRLSGRRVHPSSGRVYHIHHRPPQVVNQDDITKEPLVQRLDDTESVIKQRLAIYRQQTRPVIRYYQKLIKSRGPLAPQYYNVAGYESIENIQQQINSFILNYS